MSNLLIIISLIFLVINLILISLLYLKVSKTANTQGIIESLKIFENNLNRIENSFREELQRNRQESSATALANRTELATSMDSMNTRLSSTISDQAVKTEGRLEKMRETIESKLREIQQENTKKLDEMRNTVDEKLTTTLNSRITESFGIVTKQLEEVHRGLGDMQKLATGVGDLKKVLSNVKTRGILGEIQLGNILEQYLSSDQFIRNATIKQGSRENVEYAIKLPGNENPEEPVLLAIDSKFPIEDYQRLLEVYENISDYSKDDIIKAEKLFDASVRKSAKDINQKYISPPETTNFAIMFVPTEGLYAQILTRTGLFESIQREFNVTVVGPSNLVAFLSSLQMGFRTLAVQKRSSEVWQILGAVKTEFESFEKVLDAAQKQINIASGNLEKLVGTRTRAIKRKLSHIQELPADEAVKLIPIAESESDVISADEEKEEDIDK